jgi:putative membrane-bound dehydrogenase-like protein
MIVAGGIRSTFGCPLSEESAMFRHCFIALLASASLSSALFAGDGNRLTYLDEPANPYYVHRNFPKLTTPMWVGEEGVEAVVIFAIDDMRGPEKWEAYLRPILERLKKIDGRAPVSIMTCQVDPQHPHLQKWLQEGVSLECHTFDHPCPLFKDGDLAKAKSTYDRCVDMMFAIPNNKPVAFRTPCCDSLNTNSPRMYAEMFNKVTPPTPPSQGGEKKGASPPSQGGEKKGNSPPYEGGVGGVRVAGGNFLHIDSSVFNLFTANDPSLPRELVLDADGRERFRKYLPTDRSFVNVIEDYPYPYVIGRLCWEFPCMTPSDWQANHLHKPNNPITVRDWQAALDCTVKKQGIFCMVFHPHGWIKSEQIIDLIDYAERKHGKKVKFLNFKEALERLNKNVLGGQALRDEKGRDNGVRLLDVNNDGWMDVVVGNDKTQKTRLWSPGTRSWQECGFPFHVVWSLHGQVQKEQGAHFGVLRPNGFASRLCLPVGNEWGAWHFDGARWAKDDRVLEGLGEARYEWGVRLRDLDHDGSCEVIVASPSRQSIYRWDSQKQSWVKGASGLPAEVSFPNDSEPDAGLRFIDLDGDGHDDIVFSNEERYGIWLFESMEKGWKEVVSVKRQAGKTDAIPPITIKGANNGFFVHSRQLWWNNETTTLLKDHMDRRSFAEVLKDVPPQPKSPEASLRCIQCRPGFTVELMAAEPLVQDPIAFSFGPDGKLWVVEMGDYPNGVDSGRADGRKAAGNGKLGTGRVKFLESNDGKYDKGTIFLDGLSFATSVLPWRKGVLIACAPDILYAEDTDGDGKADKVQVLFTGFKEGNPQHRVNGLSYGLDGWVYGANGDSGGVITSTQRKQVPGVNISGRDFRFKPDTGEFEAVTGQTQYGRSRDDWGNWFGGNNSNPLWHFVLEDRYLKRNPHFAPPNPRVDVPTVAGNAPVFPISRTLPRFNDFHTANRFTSACSPIIYRDDLFGPHFAENAFICEPVHNLVHREVLSPNGVSFKSRRAPGEEQSEFIASTDNWFRPVFVQTGPDGALWIADMYRFVIEHPEWIPKETQKTLDLRAGHDKGRIYRVYPVDKKPRPIPRLDKLSTEELVKALDSPNGWQRDMAMMLLTWKADPFAFEPLEALIYSSVRPEVRVQALCTLDAMPHRRLGSVVELLITHPHPAVRRHVIRLAEQLWIEPRTESPLFQRVCDLASDPDLQVRLQLALTLGHWKNPKYDAVLGELLVKSAGDRYLTAAVMSSLDAKNIEPVLVAVLAGGRAEGRLLQELLRMADAFGNERALRTILNVVATPKEGQYAVWQFEALATLLDNLEQRKSSLEDVWWRGDAGMKAVITKLLPLFQEAHARAGKPGAAGQLAAVALLGRYEAGRKEDLKLLTELLGPQSGHDVQSAALAALGRMRDPQVPKVLTGAWKASTPPLRMQMLDILSARADWLPAVIAAIESKEIQPIDIDAAHRQRLLDHEKAEIRARTAKLFAGSIDKDRQKVIDTYKSALTIRGDPAKGQPLFAKNCSTCHKLAGVGNEVGPDLAAMKDKSPAVLLEAILDPNRAVEARYVSYTALTQNGLTITGLLHTETSNSITLVGTDGKPQTILRTNLERLQSTGKSAMPEGLEKDITPEQMADLLAYLTSALPQPKRKEFVGNQPALVKPNADGILNLRAENAEIYGTSLVFEPQFANLGWWTNEDDHAVWMIEVPKAGKYQVHFNYACADNAAGDSFVMTLGERRVSGKVAGTGAWESYRQIQVGEVELPPGQLRVVMRSEGKIRSALIDLRTVRLIPVK